jgi:hypothetical protein
MSAFHVGVAGRKLGCALPVEAAPAAPTRALTKTGIRRSVAISLLVGATVAAPTLPASAQAIPGSETPGSRVEELLAIVRGLNPAVAAAALEREAALAKVVPAGALDDPTVNFLRDQGFRQTMVTVSQDFPLWGKRTLRREVAEAQASAARGREDTATTVSLRMSLTVVPPLAVSGDHVVVMSVLAAAKRRPAAEASRGWPHPNGL